MRGTDMFISDDEAESVSQFLLFSSDSSWHRVAAISLSALSPRFGFAQGSGQSGAPSRSIRPFCPDPYCIPSFGPGLGAQSARSLLQILEIRAFQGAGLVPRCT